MREATVETRGRDRPYQTVIKMGDSGPRIHIFWRGDADPDCHDHPADFLTFPLTSYVEWFERPDGTSDTRLVKAFRLHHRKAEFSHRVLGRYVPGSEKLLGFAGWEHTSPIVTLVWWGKKRREWGFWVSSDDQSARRWVPWKTYTGTPETATGGP